MPRKPARKTPRRAPKWRRRADARPAEILDAALACFAENGFAATRLDDVAKRAGVSERARKNRPIRDRMRRRHRARSPRSNGGLAGSHPVSDIQAFQQVHPQRRGSMRRIAALSLFAGALALAPALAVAAVGAGTVLRFRVSDWPTCTVTV